MSNRDPLTDKDVVVDAHSEDQQGESEKLQGVEDLPANTQRHRPDDQRPDGVEHHPGIAENKNEPS